MNKIVGKKRRSRKKKAAGATIRRKTSRRKATRSSQRSAVTLEITIALPSGAKLSYSSFGALQKDARVLSEAAEQVTG